VVGLAFGDQLPIGVGVSVILARAALSLAIENHFVQSAAFIKRVAIAGADLAGPQIVFPAR
jgi:hypothetical protein